MKRFFTTLLIITLLFVAKGFAVADSVRIGDTWYHDDGTWTILSGNTFYHSTGAWTMLSGNTCYNSDGTYIVFKNDRYTYNTGFSYKRIGNVIYFNGRPQAVKQGDAWITTGHDFIIFGD